MRRKFTGSGRRLAVTALAVAIVPLTLSACGGGKESGTAGETAGAAPSGTTGAAPAPGATTPAGTTAAGAAAGGGAAKQPSDITKQMVAEGDSIFHGQLAGGTCQTCHGANAKGTPLAPDLTDNKWITGDGSYQFIINTDTHGVPNPSPPYTAPMPPMGGATLSPTQIDAVAAYVYSLSHPNVGKK
ncbi:MAG TPA: c-type cytochrome [Gemmatimonadaceae bacterium]|nr:c-type cytochrome [Gemmatimonadaceae bacterium]